MAACFHRRIMVVYRPTVLPDVVSPFTVVAIVAFQAPAYDLGVPQLAIAVQA